MCFSKFMEEKHNELPFIGLQRIKNFPKNYKYEYSTIIYCKTSVPAPAPPLSVISAPAPAPAPAIYSHLKLYYNNKTIRNMAHWRFFFILASFKLTAVNIY